MGLSNPSDSGFGVVVSPSHALEVDKVMERGIKKFVHHHISLSGLLKMLR
jgi:hypothetical protein